MPAPETEGQAEDKEEADAVLPQETETEDPDATDAADPEADAEEPVAVLVPEEVFGAVTAFFAKCRGAVEVRSETGPCQNIPDECYCSSQEKNAPSGEQDTDQQ